MPLAGELQRPENGDGGWWLIAEGDGGREQEAGK